MQPTAEFMPRIDPEKKRNRLRERENVLPEEDAEEKRKHRECEVWVASERQVGVVRKGEAGKGKIKSEGLQYQS